jgi:hypothetical protein
MPWLGTAYTAPDTLPHGSARTMTDEAPDDRPLWVPKLAIWIGGALLLLSLISTELPALWAVLIAAAVTGGAIAWLEHRREQAGD